MTTPQQLSQLELFAGLSPEQLAPLAELAHELTCPEGQALFREGGPATHLYVLLEGKVEIEVRLSSRPESLTLAVLTRPGQLVGWSGVLPPSNYTASAICAERSRLLAFDGQKFMLALERDPELGFAVMRHIAGVISDRLRNIQRVVLKTL